MTGSIGMLRSLEATPGCLAGYSPEQKTALARTCHDLFQKAFKEGDVTTENLSLALAKKAHLIQQESGINLEDSLIVGTIKSQEGAIFPITLKLAKASPFLSSMTVDLFQEDSLSIENCIIPLPRSSKQIQNYLDFFDHQKAPTRGIVVSHRANIPSLANKTFSDILSAFCMAAYLSEGERGCKHLVTVLEEYIRMLPLGKKTDCLRKLLELEQDHESPIWNEPEEKLIKSITRHICDIKDLQRLAEALGPCATELKTLRLPPSLSQSVSSEQLQYLSTLFPNITRLDISDSQQIILPVIPELWKNNLQKFNAANCMHLVDISSLNGARNLRILDVHNSSVTALPEGCTALETCLASECSELENISGLNNSPNLRILDVRNSSVTVLPGGCTALETCLASECSGLENISGLNNSPNLRILDVRNSSVTALPEGCTALKECYANDCRQLGDISGLNNSPNLRILQLNKTDIGRLPERCTALEECHARDCRQLLDISGLNNLRNLRILYLNKSDLIETLPRRCEKLEECQATCERLRDVSGLNNLKNLKELNLSDTAITRPPHGCVALLRCALENCTQLKTIEPLNNLPRLRFLDCYRTQITEPPDGCGALTRFVPGS